MLNRICEKCDNAFNSFAPEMIYKLYFLDALSPKNHSKQSATGKRIKNKEWRKKKRLTFLRTFCIVKSVLDT